MRRPRARTHRIDARQKRIVKVLRSVGAAVLSMAELGGGVADLLVRYHGRLFILEVKNPDAMPTDDQLAWLAIWGGVIVHDEQEALRAVGGLQ